MLIHRLNICNGEIGIQPLHGCPNWLDILVCVAGGVYYQAGRMACEKKVQLRRFTQGPILAVRHEPDYLNPRAIAGIQVQTFSQRIFSRPEAVGEHLVYNCYRSRAVRLARRKIAARQQRRSHGSKETGPNFVVEDFRPLVIGNWIFILNIDVAIAQIACAQRRKRGGTNVDHSRHGPDFFQQAHVKHQTLRLRVTGKVGVDRGQ